MTRLRELRLRDESGQTLVFFVLILTSLMLMLGMVVDVGAWLRTQRKLQTVVDAAALAAVPELPFDQNGARATANTYATRNGVTLQPSWLDFPEPATISVTAKEDAPGIFARLAGIFNVNIRVTARARVEAPAVLNNDDLRQVAGNDTYIVPVVVNSRAVCTWSGCFGSGSPQSLDFDSSDRNGSDFGLANISCSGSCSSPSSRTFRNWVRRRPAVSGDIAAGSSFAPVTSGVGRRARSAFNSLEDDTVIFPVFDRYDSSTGSYHIIGFTAFVVTDVPVWDDDAPGCRCKVIDGYFVNYTTPGKLATSPGNGPCDAASPERCYFGVRQVGLTN